MLCWAHSGLSFRIDNYVLIKIIPKSDRVAASYVWLGMNIRTDAVAPESPRLDRIISRRQWRLRFIIVEDIVARERSA